MRAYRDARGPEAWRVYAVIAKLVRAGDPRSTRDAVILQLLFVLGLRRQSVADLQLADIDEDALWLRVKGDEEPVRKTLPGSTRRALAAWLAFRGDAPGPLFTGLRQGERDRGLTASQIYRISRKRGVGNPHGLRHSSATKLAREGHNVFDIQGHLGHASPMTSQHYVDNVEDNAGQAAAYLAEQLDELYDSDDG